jgi:tRNA(Ile2) C34 agmatinyltransferase TiaS
MFTGTSPQSPTCPVCPGRGTPLGQLGRLRWYRCRDCGIDFNRRAKAPPSSSPRPAGRAS